MMAATSNSPSPNVDSQLRIQLVCQFGKPTRGLSPYADSLWSALERIDGLSMEAVDFHSAFPRMLHPAGGAAGITKGQLSWYNPATWRRVANQPAQVLHLQHWAPPLASYLWPLASMARRRGKKVVITVHNPEGHERSGLFDEVETRLLRAADALVVHGEYGMDALRIRLGIRCPEIRSIPHGLQTALEPVSPNDTDYRRLCLNPDCRHVLLFGNLRGYKGVDVLLRAWKIVAQQLPGVRLVIAGRFWGGGNHSSRLGARLAGSARDAEELQALMSGNGLPAGVVLRDGFQSDEDIDSLISICEFAVFPYVRFSGQSGAACRAASQGRGVLVSRVGGLPELAIDHSWVTKPGDAEALASSLLQKLSIPNVAMAEGRRQLDAIRPFGWDSVAQQHAMLYRELL